jgi:transcription elongation factor Elf1
MPGPTNLAKLSCQICGSKISRSINGEMMKIWNYSLSYRIDGEGELIEKANTFLEK